MRLSQRLNEDSENSINENHLHRVPELKESVSHSRYTLFYLINEQWVLEVFQLLTLFYHTYHPSYKIHHSKLHPPFPVLLRNEFVGGIKVGDLHVFRVPKQFLPAGEFVVGIFIGPTAECEVAHQDRFRKWSGIIEGGTYFVLTISCDAGVYPLLVVAFGYASQFLRETESFAF